MDRLSSLHPPLLSKIISFLRTKKAIKLAILSRHWRHISSSLVKLLFLREDPEKPETFRDCIDRALASHDETDIQQFYIKEPDSDDSIITDSDLNRWITLLLPHNVREIRLSIYTEQRACLPRSLFTCGTLEVLSLSSIKIEDPCFFSFPKLKTFILSDFEFIIIDGAPITMSFHATNFPALENLNIDTMQRIGSLSVSTPSFKYLILSTMNSFGLKLSISTQQKLRFNYIGHPLDISTIDVSRETCSSLCSANFDMIWDQQQMSLTPTDATKIMATLRNTVMLSLSVFFMEFLSWDRSFASQSRTFSLSLKHLGLVMFRAKKNHVKIVKVLTHSFPQLQTLRIILVDTPESMIVLEESELPTVANDMVMIRHFRNMEFVYFKGTENELEIAKHFLATATMLENFCVGFSVDMDVDTQERVKLDLMSSLRVSQKPVRFVFRQERWADYKIEL